jgi:dTDP-4-dehydrorhamnose reductase
VKVLVTGALGMLGQDVVAIATAQRHEVVAVDYEHLDITDAGAVEQRIERMRPDAVINCAGWTDVDGAEENEAEAMAVNAEGAANLAAATARIEARLVYPSTDYVFDGSKRKPYLESDKPAPLNAYGRSKAAGERATADGNRRSYVVRSAWLFGPGGSNFVETMLRLGRGGGHVMVVHDQVGCPTYTGHLAAGLVRVIDGPAYGIHHMAGSGSCSWFAFAEEIFRQASVSCRVFGATSDMLGRKAERPKYSALVSGRDTPIVLPPWERGLSDYLARRARTKAREAQGPEAEGKGAETDQPAESATDQPVES